MRGTERKKKYFQSAIVPECQRDDVEIFIKSRKIDLTAAIKVGRYMTKY